MPLILKKYISVISMILLIILSLYFFAKNLGERAAWKIFDKLTRGSMRIENFIGNERYFKTFGNYRLQMEETLRDLDTMDFEEFKTRYKRQLELECKIAGVAERMLKSYKESVLDNEL